MRFTFQTLIFIRLKFLQLSMWSISTVLFWEVAPVGETLNLVRLIVSQTYYYGTLSVSTFYVKQFNSFILGVSLRRGPPNLSD